MAAKRGRPRKQEVEEIEDDELSVDPEPELVETPVMKVVERREYVRPMDPTDTGVGQVLEATADHGLMDDTDAAFADFMSEADGEAPKIRVMKLKDSFRPGSERYTSAQGSFCDEMPLTTDWLKLIQVGWGGGY